MRVINFNAGPAGLPLPALERARDENIARPEYHDDQPAREDRS